MVIFSTTEGEDKPMKYPHMFKRALADLRAVNPEAAVLCGSARTGQGLSGWYDWLRHRLAAVREAAFA